MSKLLLLLSTNGWHERIALLLFKLLMLLFTKERPLFKKEQKSERAKERKSETFVFLSELLFCSFAHKERAIPSKNQTVNSRPCYVIAYPPIHHIALLLLLSTVPGPLISTVPSPPISTVHSPLTTLCLALTLALS